MVVTKYCNSFFFTFTFRKMFGNKKKKKEKQVTSEINTAPPIIDGPNDALKKIDDAIEQLKKARVDACDHKPIHENGVRVVTEILLFSYSGGNTPVNSCKFCGTPLKATGWEVANV